MHFKYYAEVKYTECKRQTSAQMFIDPLGGSML